MPGCGHNCVSVTITKTGALSPEWASVHVSSADCGGWVTHWCQLPAQSSWSLLTTLNTDPDGWGVLSSELCPLSHSRRYWALWQRCTVHSGLHSDTTNFLGFLTQSEWGRVGTRAPSGRSGSGPGCQSYSQRVTSTQTRGATRETRGSRGQAGVLELSLFSLMCWRRLVACGTDNTQAPDTQPWSHHTRPGTRAESWENRAEQSRAVITGSWEQPRTGSTGLCCPACAAL